MYFLNHLSHRGATEQTILLAGFRLLSQMPQLGNRRVKVMYK